MKKLNKFLNRLHECLNKYMLDIYRQYFLINQINVTIYLDGSGCFNCYDCVECRNVSFLDFGPNELDILYLLSEEELIEKINAFEQLGLKKD